MEIRLFLQYGGSGQSWRDFHLLFLPEVETDRDSVENKYETQATQSKTDI